MTAALTRLDGLLKLIKDLKRVYMDGSYGKRAVSGASALKKKPVSGVRDTTAGNRDGTGPLCSRIGCSGRLNTNTKGVTRKPLEKPKPLKPSIHSSSSKEVTGSSSSTRKGLIVQNSKMESSSVSKASGTQTRKLKSKTTEIRKEESRVQNSESNIVRKKRLTQGESSSLGKGKKIIGASTTEGRVFDSKSSRNLVSSRTSNVVSSVRTRKPLNLEASKGSNSRQPAKNVITNMPQTQESSHNGDHNTSDSSADRSIAGFRNDNGSRHYTIDGIADVLLALSRFEEDDELTYEQLLEASLFLGGLNFFDQHRDMRLDIDNMSYEELLVLEEKMGTVSTALSAEELSKCIKTGVYECVELEDEKMMPGSCADDKKCSICQEEFVRGDEVGRLGCGHGYHTACINQWLGLKNWCPICKASPQPLSTDS
ncbi:uncharacterized protein LOC143543249 [Bidens hawaiensis]|uniref:uncharacterized protein LOC143543249 n=1 Tax=Bidens hawaiensis TaxID=980011 RepID=UPI0040497804